MEPKRKKLLLLLLLAVLLIVIGVYVYQQKQKSVVINQADTTEKIVNKEIDVADVPGGLPENLPIEAGVKILQNYQSTTIGDRVQATRKFETKKTLPMAIKTYNDFFTKRGWKTVEEKKSEDMETLLMKRNESTILVVASKDTVLNTNVIEITLNESRKTNE